MNGFQVGKDNSDIHCDCFPCFMVKDWLKEQVQGRESKLEAGRVRKAGCAWKTLENQRKEFIAAWTHGTKGCVN